MILIDAICFLVTNKCIKLSLLWLLTTLCFLSFASDHWLWNVVEVHYWKTSNNHRKRHKPAICIFSYSGMLCLYVLPEECNFRSTLYTFLWSTIPAAIHFNYSLMRKSEAIMHGNPELKVTYPNCNKEEEGTVRDVKVIQRFSNSFTPN